MNERKPGKLYGLFIGVNRYDSEQIADLRFACTDARDVRNAFMRRFKLEPNYCISLLDEAPGDSYPDRRRVLKALDRFSKAPVKPNDTIIFLFAGHGFCRGGHTFLGTSDTEPGSEILLKETAVPLDTVREFFAGITAGQHLLILDACRNVSVAGTRSGADNEMPAQMSRDIQSVASSAGASATSPQTIAKAVICSCWEGQVAYEYPQGKHGWFCHNLLKELEGAGEEPLSIADLHSGVKNRMQETCWNLLPEAQSQMPHLEIAGEVPVLQAEPGGNIQGTTTDTNQGIAEQEPAPATPKTDIGVQPNTEESSVLLGAEKALIDGRTKRAKSILRKNNRITDTADVLECVARLAQKPVRKLRNREAKLIAERLAELHGGEWSSLASFLARLLEQKYYRPLRRRVPEELQVILNGQTDVEQLTERERNLASVISEGKELISSFER